MRVDGADRSHIHYLTSCFYLICFRFDEKSTAKSTANLFCCPLTSCHVPDDWIVKTKRPLLLSREVLKTVVATWRIETGETPC